MTVLVLGLIFGFAVLLWFCLMLTFNCIIHHYEYNAEKHEINDEHLYKKDLKKLKKLDKISNFLYCKWSVIIGLILFFSFLFCICLADASSQSANHKNNTKCDKCNSHLSLKDIEHDSNHHKDYFYYECDNCQHIEKYDYSLK